MKRVTMIARLLLGGLLVSGVLCVPVTEKKQKVTKRDIGSLSRGGDNMAVDSYRGEILPGMVDDQVAEAFLKDAAREDERAERRKEEGDEDQEDDEDDGPIEVPLALPMARVMDDDDVLEYADEKPSPHRSKALAEDVYPSEDEGYLPYYPTEGVYFRRRRRSRPQPSRVVRKRSPYPSARDPVRSSRLRSARRKRQIRLNDNDLNALISFLTNLKVTMERASGECNNPAHHSFFREKELSEELGAGSGIDEDYSDDEQPTSPEQEYPVWLMPHSHQMESVIAGPQRRSFYYPTMLPGQKRSGTRYYSPQQRLELQSKLLGLRRVPDPDSPPRKFFQ